MFHQHAGARGAFSNRAGKLGTVMKQAAQTSANPHARLVGVVYLLYFLVGAPSLVVLREFVHGHDAAATSGAILANETMYQLAISLDLVANVIYLALTALFYNLLEPVGRRTALLMAFVSFAGCCIQLFGELFKIAPLVILKDSQLAGVFHPGQVQAAVLLSLKMYSQSYNISFVLFAFFDLLLGWLIVRSTFLPRIIGILMMCAGSCCLIFLWPPLASQLSQYIPLVAGIPELFLMLWLMVMGVNNPRWRSKTGVTEIQSLGA